jgi:cytochrome c oxidase subunit 2
LPARGPALLLENTKGLPLPQFIQSALLPRGPDASATAQLMAVLFSGGALVFVVVIALASLALFARRRRWLAGRTTIVAGGIVFPAVVLLALLVYSLLAAARITAALGSPTVHIEVVGEQWWWRVNYLDQDGDTDFTTANELRIPVGRTVELRLRSGDVLHSLWVPALAGKIDMIPGRANRLMLRADQAGVFRGQCAEYCGGPHAQMAFFVVAESEAQFDRWRAAQRQPATATNQLFEARCAACHTVRGTPAAGALGPDLTHVASRLSLGAGILANDPRSAVEWIASSQHIKPGNLMPRFDDLDRDQLAALAGYLQSLH